MCGYLKQIRLGVWKTLLAFTDSNTQRVALSSRVWQNDEKPQTGLFTGKHGSDIRVPSHTLTTLFHIMIDHLLQIHIVLSAMTIKNEAHQNKTNKPQKSTYSSQL